MSRTTAVTAMRRLGLFFAGAGVQVYEGHGLTESTAAATATANPPERTRYGTVGLVVGNDRPCIAALVTLDHEAVEHWLQMRGKPQLTAAQLVRDRDLETEVRRVVVAANTLVSQAESIRTFRVLAQPFTEEHGLLTPSLKPKRRAIENA